MLKFRWLLPILSMTLVGCNLNIDARITGYKPGAASTMMVHVKSKAGAYFTCSSSCYSCTSFTMPRNGEIDLEILLHGDPPARKVCLSGKAGLFKGDVTLDIDGPAGLPPTMEVNDTGIATCNVKKCYGSVSLLPAPGFSMSTDPGVVVEVAGKRFTTDQHGDGQTAIDVALSPAVKDLTLAKLRGLSEHPGSAKRRWARSSQIKVRTPRSALSPHGLGRCSVAARRARHQGGRLPERAQDQPAGREQEQ